MIDFSHPLSVYDVACRKAYVKAFAMARDDLCVKSGLEPHEFHPKWNRPKDPAQLSGDTDSEGGQTD